MKNISLPQTAILLPAAYALIFWLLYKFQPLQQADFLSSHVQEFRIHYSPFHLKAYVLLVLAAGVASLFMLLARTEDRIPSWNSAAVSIPAASLIALAPIFLSGGLTWFASGFVIFLAAVVAAQINGIDAGWPKGRLKYVAAVLLTAYFLVYFVMPMFLPLIVPDGARFARIDSHYAMTVLPGFDLVCCNEAGIVERSNYGLSMVLLAALAYWLATPFAVAGGELIFAVKILQLAAAGLIGVIIWRLNRKYFLPLLLLALVIAAPMTTLGETVNFPNQAGVRYIPFLAGIAFLAVGMQRCGWLALSAVSALLTLFSPETGIAVFCGYAVFLTLAKYEPENRIGSTVKVASLFAMASVLQFLIYSIVLTPWFFKGVSADLFAFVALFSAGYGGLVAAPSPISVFLLFFAILAIARGLWKARQGTVAPVDAFQAAIGAMMIAWLPYYVNRMSELNLWFQGVLLVFLFAPRFGPACLRLFRQKRRFGALYLVLAVAVTGGLFASALDRQFWSNYRLYWLVKTGCVQEPLQVAGVCFAGRRSDEVARQLEFARNIPNKQNYLAISHFPARIRQMGFNEGFPWYEPFGEIATQEQFTEMVVWIDANGPQYLITDDPTTTVSVRLTYRTGHFADMFSALGSYRRRDSAAGWVVYERLP